MDILFVLIRLAVAVIILPFIMAILFVIAALYVVYLPIAYFFGAIVGGSVIGAIAGERPEELRKSIDKDVTEWGANVGGLLAVPLNTLQSLVNWVLYGSSRGSRSDECLCAIRHLRAFQIPHTPLKFCRLFWSARIPIYRYALPGRVSA